MLSLTGPGPNYEVLLSWVNLFLWGGLAWALSRWPHERLWTLARWSVGTATVIGGIVWLKVIVEQPQPIVSPIGHVSYPGVFLALHLPLAGYLLWVSKRGERIAWLSCWIVILSALCLTGTRAAIVAFVVATVIFLPSAYFAHLLNAKKIAVALLLIAIPVLFTHWVQPKGVRGVSLESRFSELADIRTPQDIQKFSSSRWADYRAALNLVRTHPWTGWGLGSFRFVYPTVSHSVSGTDPATAERWFMHPHNEFLHQAVELGLLGVVAFAALFGGFFVLGLRRFRKAADSERRELLICGAGAATALVAWQFDTSFLFPLVRLLVALYAGIFISGGDLRPSPEPPGCGIGRAKPDPIPFDGVSGECRIPPESRKNSFIRYLLMTLTGGALEFASLFAVQKSQTASNLEIKRLWAERAYRMAPYSFNSLFVNVFLQIGHQSNSELAPIVDRFEKTYPYVPGVLYQTALFRRLQGETQAAEALLERALTYDPEYGLARGLLADIEKDR